MKASASDKSTMNNTDLHPNSSHRRIAKDTELNSLQYEATFQLNRQIPNAQPARKISSGSQRGGKCKPSSTAYNFDTQSTTYQNGRKNPQQDTWSLRQPPSDTVFGLARSSHPGAIFSKHVQLFLWSNNPQIPSRIFLVKHLMELGPDDFFHWYAIESGAPFQVSILKFELSDIHQQAVRAFLVPRRERRYFQELKKLFWDIFWIESSLTGSPRLFHLHLSIPGDDLSLGRREVTAAVNRIPIIPTTTTNASMGPVMHESPARKMSSIYKLLNSSKGNE